jgi:Cys-rich protein (TIGR01571 family)
MSTYTKSDGYTVDVETAVFTPPNSTPPAVVMASPSREKFLYGLCVCCKDCDSCLESWFCTRCQMSRQCNMMKNGHPEIDWLTCCASYIVDALCAGGLLAFIFVCQTRRMARERYGIAGGCCGDCCVGWLCAQCAIQQILLEMATRGDFPGACCYQVQQLPAYTNMY